MSTHEPPKVMIVGAGMGGLMLANFLERQSVPYVIYEWASQLKALGMHPQNSDLTPLFTKNMTFAAVRCQCGL
ncbi:hypothetical protein KVV02_002330 [Mortierella alpina]|uniref:Uncharacterized protein n=1 Tax=Mortierella alpina TaxID=64518 RepID=A0A9P8CWV7_MORAP|nr:hypothetical protein KVV02_002330 [Mortierella alpina]